MEQAIRGVETPARGTWQMASKIECPKCGGLGANLIRGVCRSCYMRDYHQRRSAAAVTQCPTCGVASANFVYGVCRSCYMRDYHQRRDKQRVLETPTLGDSESQRLCVKCKAWGIYAQGLCLDCYMRERRCVECGVQGIYARSLCRNCYVLDRQHRQRQRFCVECGALGVHARSLCQNCYARDVRRHHRIKHRVCAVCGVPFQSVRRDALYCSFSCGQKAHRAGHAQPFPKAAHVGARGAAQSAITTQDATLAARIEVQAHALGDVDRRPGQIDSTIEEAAKRGRTNAAVLAIDGHRKARQVLAGDLKTERAALGTNGHQLEPAAAPIRHVADTDSERAILWFLALMVLCCDPPAMALTAAAAGIYTVARARAADLPTKAQTTAHH